MFPSDCVVITTLSLESLLFVMKFFWICIEFIEFLLSWRVLMLSFEGMFCNMYYVLCELSVTLERD